MGQTSWRTGGAASAYAKLGRRRTTLAAEAKIRVREYLETSKVEAGPEAAIPMLGFAVVNDSRNYTLRLLRSIDHPVDKIVVVWFPMFNGQHDTGVGRQLCLARQLFPSIVIRKMPYNMGCAAGWNEVIYENLAASWWALPNFDIEFPPGALAVMSRRVFANFSAPPPEGNGCAPRTYHTMYGHKDAPDMGYSFFMVSRNAVAHTGLFDENFYPAYWEDNDYRWRVRLSCPSQDGEVIDTDQKTTVVHGPGNETEYESGMKVSLSISNDTASKLNSELFLKYNQLNKLMSIPDASNPIEVSYERAVPRMKKTNGAGEDYMNDGLDGDNGADLEEVSAYVFL
ncbi:hypothetical protein CYMTET_3274 [Cymbomonas tetramitiformis]|uniref:Uncharacterized protein n=1 Tax=Cymbomonas tetramitiformis TaxID=36881 RepID=A0AAE0H3M8_9CHLO|nr:hypothetical protein CYMTET_3274 [Cymbomonas tetramitiformis]